MLIFNVNINNKINNYNATFISPAEGNSTFSGPNYITVNYTYLPKQDSVFSQAALNQVATTRGLTSALLTTLDLWINNEQINQIAGDAGLIAGHLVSIGEYINKISNDIIKKNKN